MNKQIIAITLMILAMTVSAAAAAGPMPQALTQGKGYIGANYTELTYDQDGMAKDPEPTVLVGRLGYFIIDQIAVEGRLGFGLSDDTIQVDTNGSTKVEFEIDRLSGVYLLTHLPISNGLSFYGLVGYTKAKITPRGYALSDTENGFSYGFGAELHSSDQFGLNIEYTQYLDEKGYDLSGISLGAKIYF